MTMAQTMMWVARVLLVVATMVFCAAETTRRCAPTRMVLAVFAPCVFGCTYTACLCAHYRVNARA